MAITPFETHSPCNCPWRECRAHEDALCPRYAMAWKCAEDGCGEVHYIGDAILGAGISLCEPCSRAFHEFLVQDIYEIFREIGPEVPESETYLYRVVDFYRRAWTRKIFNREPWPELMEDIGALGALIGLCFKYVSAEQSAALIVYMDRLISLQHDLNSDASGTEFKWEKLL